MSEILSPAILVFRSAALGDFIICTPALRKLRELFPAHRIIFLTTQSSSRTQREKVAAYAGGTASMPWVEMARPHLIDELLVLDDHLVLATLFGLRAELKRRDIRKAFLLVEPGTPWQGRIKKLILLRLLVGLVPTFGWRGPGWFLWTKGRVHKNGRLLHHVTGALQFMREVSPPQKIEDQRITFDLRPGEAAEQWAWGWLSKHGLEERRWVAVAPGAIQPHKQWPIEKFESLCGQLLKESADLHFVVLGTKNDVVLGNRLVESVGPRVHNLAGMTSIAQSAALLAHCSLLVGNDGGAMHLGSAMGARVVSIVPGLEYPGSIEPWHSQDLAVRHTVPCAPCYSFTRCPLGHNRCMVDLPLAAVLEKCRTGLQGSAKVGSSAGESRTRRSCEDL